MMEKTYRDHEPATNEYEDATIPDHVPDKEGLYWWTHPGEPGPFLGYLFHGDPSFIVCLGEDTEYKVTAEYEAISKPLEPDDAERLDAAMLHIEHLEALAAQVRALPADTDEIPGLRRELKSLKRQAGEYLGEERPEALRDAGGGDP